MHTGQEGYKEKISHIHIHTRKGREKVMQLVLT